MKKWISVILIATLVLTSTAGVSAAEKTNVSIDGQLVVYTQASGVPFVDASHRTQVPFRQTMEKYGATVMWEEDTQTAIAKKDGITLRVPIGKKFIYKNDEKLENDTAAMVKDGRTYLPIAAVLKAFGADVKWDGTTNTVVVTSGTAGPPMTIHFLDVGQADAILVDYGEFEILIDGGNAADGSEVVAYLKRFVNGPLEVIVATHEHEDHIGGLPAVLSAYSVGKVIDNGRTADTKIYREYEAAVAAEGCPRMTAGEMTIDMGNAKLQILEMAGTYSDPNDNSVIAMVDYGNTQVLLMGDAGQRVEKANLMQFRQADVLKAGHHGSDTASGSEFLAKVKPETVIVSCATGNTYKHPHLAALQRFAKVGAKVYGTEKAGTVVLTTNGSTYNLNTNRTLLLSDAGDNTVTAPTAPAGGGVTKAEASYVGNSSTKKLHRITCRYVSGIAEQNVVYFMESTDAAGYEGCKVCNPLT